MELGIIGLGRMGANMTERLVLGGHRLISFDRKSGGDTASASIRARSARTPSPTSSGRLVLCKVIAALRNEFGGHAVKKG